MSFYNMVNGENPNSALVLHILNEKEPITFPRYRDAYIQYDGYAGGGFELVVLTRTGGGNREEYEAENDDITMHPLYLRDHDDNFDSTYALWFFNVPENHLPVVTMLYDKYGGENEPSLREKTQKAIEQIRIMAPDELAKRYPQLCKFIENIAREDRKA